MLRRRDFLGLSSLALTGGMPGLFARAAEASARADANDHALVVIELRGGNDGLNTVIPFEDPLYYRNRRTLGIPKGDVIRLGASDLVGFHPRMGALGELFHAGEVAVVQGVGYPEPNRSHFRSIEIWHTGSCEPKAPPAGWLGRYLDAEAPASASDGDGDGPADAFPRGLSLTDILPQALQARRAIVPVVAEIDAFGGLGGPEAALLRKLSIAREGGQGRDGAAGAEPGPGPVAFLRRQAETLYRTADRLRAVAEKSRTTVEYPEGNLGEQLRRGAQILGAGLGVRVLYATQDGYDTHANQADEHGNLLEALSASLAAFRRDLDARGLAGKVLVMVFSEFGRRVDENASRGTDHGAASCLFLVGARVNGGLAGRYPALDKLGDGDLLFNTDFRSVYATLLDRWMGCPPAETLGARYPLLDLIATS